MAGCAVHEKKMLQENMAALQRQEQEVEITPLARLPFCCTRLYI